MDLVEERSEFKNAGKSPAAERSEFKSAGKSSSAAEECERNVKICADCGTAKTPLWRGGPAGPKSLCNACGIRSRKKRKPVVGLNRGGEVERKSNRINNGGGNQAKIGGNNLKMRLKWRVMGEEERAATLLMALSYGSVYA